MDDKRSDLFPEVPTFKEQGVNVVFGTWRGIGLPKKVDPAIKKEITDIFTKAMKDKDFVEFAKKSGQNLAYQDSDAFGKFLAENYELVDKTMDSIGLKKK